MPRFQMGAGLGLIADEMMGGAEQPVRGRQPDRIGNIFGDGFCPLSQRQRIVEPSGSEPKQMQIAQQPELVETVLELFRELEAAGQSAKGLVAVSSG